MLTPSDYKELLKLLNRHKVRYLIVGAYAVIYYTEPRYTKDLDIWVDPKIENAKRVYEALKEFGAPLRGITAKEFTKKSLFYQIGIAPIRVDIIMGISDLEFDVAWEQRNITTLEGIKVNILGINELIKSKEKVKRHLDLADIEALKYKLRLKRGK